MCRSNLDDKAEHLLVVEAGLLLKAVGDKTRFVALDVALQSVGFHKDRPRFGQPDWTETIDP